ncbi:unnamed protein product [Acanthoscelides obtectus]|uniref:PiggyBac transposable element-derived protein domain-containing protein n=1 Tax=Acanthoscelides obtectus TaxID=200917 RepID=A0A9P0Q936_ACAOB|nr:unnamed protein product [Acanthoscelides obtectus]CAK1630335.1 PiggyBac transposable element-derived protein 3 [Acanthoscelides obtectus]
MERGSMVVAVGENNKIAGIPLQKCLRYSAKEKKKIEIPQPFIVKQYNRYMGGVDQLDNHISNYRIAMRGKKWYTPLMYWAIDVCVVNSWNLARQYGYKKDQLDFRRGIAKELLSTYGREPPVAGKKRAAIRYPASASGRHLIITGEARRRCQSCKNKTNKRCDTCKVPLHDKCFLEYHNS